MARRKTAGERDLLLEVGSLRSKTDKMENRLEAAADQNGRTIVALSKVVDIAFDDKKVIAELSNDLRQTRASLVALERRLGGFLDTEQKEIARVCGVTDTEFACEYMRFLHDHRDMINEIQTMRNH